MAALAPELSELGQRRWASQTPAVVFQVCVVSRWGGRIQNGRRRKKTEAFSALCKLDSRIASVRLRSRFLTWASSRAVRILPGDWSHFQL